MALHPVISNFPDNYYKAVVTMVGARPSSVEGYVNREYIRSFASRWERALPDVKSLIPGKWSKLVNVGLNVVGMSAENKKAQVRMWAGCDPLSFNFTMEFVTDPSMSAAFIEGQLLGLEKMVTPGNGPGGFLKPPGPGLVTSFFENKDSSGYSSGGGGEGYTTIRIGSKTLSNVVITGVSVNRKMDFSVDNKGNKATFYATAQIQGSTQYIITREELR